MKCIILIGILATLPFLSGCAPTPTITYDYRWRILDATVWQPNYFESAETGIALDWSDPGERSHDFNADLTIWRYPLDTLLVVTTGKEPHPPPDGDTYEVTRMKYEIRNKPLRFNIFVDASAESIVRLEPGKYFVHISPGQYSDVRIRNIVVKRNSLSLVKVELTAKPANIR
jgi:hypothetical protein